MFCVNFMVAITGPSPSLSVGAVPGVCGCWGRGAYLRVRARKILLSSPSIAGRRGGKRKEGQRRRGRGAPFSFALIAESSLPCGESQHFLEWQWVAQPRGCSRAVVGASSLVEFIRCKLGSSLGPRMNPDARSPVHLS